MAKAKQQESAAKRLQAMRAELISAEARLKEAEAAMDLDLVVTLRQRAEAARTFIAALVNESRVEVEADGARRAREWVSGQSAVISAAVKEVEEAQAAALTAMSALVDAVQKEAHARKRVEATVLGAEFLARRFQLDLPETAQPAALPAQRDFVTPVISAAEMMRPSQVMKRGFGVVVTNGMSAARRREEELRVLAKWVSKHGGSLPGEVLDILRYAPIPEETSTAKGPSEREQQEMRRMSQTVAGLRSLPFPVAGQL